MVGKGLNLENVERISQQMDNVVLPIVSIVVERVDYNKS